MATYLSTAIIQFFFLTYYFTNANFVCLHLIKWYLFQLFTTLRKSKNALYSSPTITGHKYEMTYVGLGRVR